MPKNDMLTFVKHCLETRHFYDRWSPDYPWLSDKIFLASAKVKMELLLILPVGQITNPCRKEKSFKDMFCSKKIRFFRIKLFSCLRNTTCDHLSSAYCINFFWQLWIVYLGSKCMLNKANFFIWVVYIQIIWHCSKMCRIIDNNFVLFEMIS